MEGDTLAVEGEHQPGESLIEPSDGGRYPCGCCGHHRRSLRSEDARPATSPASLSLYNGSSPSSRIRSWSPKPLFAWPQKQTGA